MMTPLAGLARAGGALRGEKSGQPNTHSPHHFHQPHVGIRVIPRLRQELPDRVFLPPEKPRITCC
jgi:hypothetical protein